MAKDRSKKLPRELEAFREEVLARLDRIEAKLDRGGAPATIPAPLAPPAEDPVPESPAPHFLAETFEGGPPAGRLPADAPDLLDSLADGEIRVIVSPLNDVRFARAVESSLAASEGVEQATLRELRGDSATIDVRAGEDFSVLSSLRRRLPVAFDVTSSDERSVTIAPAQPQAGSGDGVAVRPNP